MTHTKSRGVVVYTDAEIAMIFNWNDHCLIEDCSFKETIMTTLKEGFGIDRTLQGVLTKMYAVLKQHNSKRAPTVAKVLVEGTRCIDITHFKGKLGEELRKGRKDLELPLLGDEYVLAKERASQRSTVRTRAVMQPPFRSRVLLTYLQAK